ncbi:MAG: ATP-binding protein [Deltaproteobacteria bacterium]|nr:ATP-binding protein [Deltaproteobacteria bacterium]
MITSFHVSNFKQLNSLDLTGLTPITIIGGKNNVGKTTLLEALILFYDRSNPSVTVRQFAWRGVTAIEVSPMGVWGPLFSAYDIKQAISMELTDDKVKERVVLTHNPNPRRVLTTKISKEDTSYIPSTPPEALDIEYYVSGKDVGKAHLFIEDDKIGINIENMSPYRKNTIYISSDAKPNSHEEAKLFGKLDVKGKTEELIESLKLIEPRLKSLSAIPIGDSSLIHGDVGLGRKIPLSFMGEGVVKLFHIVLAVLSFENGIVLIDEIENGFHYSVHDKLWLLLADLSTRHNCQIIATTHSWEILEGLKTVTDAAQQELFSYVRLDAAEGKIIPKVYTLDVLLAALNRNWEVR